MPALFNPILPRFVSSAPVCRGVIWGAGGRRPQKKKERKKEKVKREKKRKENRMKGYVNNVKLLHIKCCFLQFFNSPVALKNKKNFGLPRKSWNDAPARVSLQPNLARICWPLYSWGGLSVKCALCSDWTHSLIQTSNSCWPKSWVSFMLMPKLNSIQWLRRWRRRQKWRRRCRWVDDNDDVVVCDCDDNNDNNCTKTIMMMTTMMMTIMMMTTMMMTIMMMTKMIMSIIMMTIIIMSIMMMTTMMMTIMMMMIMMMTIMMMTTMMMTTMMINYKNMYSLTWFLFQTNEPSVISYLIEIDFVSICLKIMESCIDKSRTVSAWFYVALKL